jgi:ferredoxin
VATSNNPTVTSKVALSEVVVLRLDGLDSMVAKLAQLGFDTKGPVVRDGAVVPGPITGVGDLPCGVHDEQAPGSYQLNYSDDGRLFDWAVGPGSWKAEFFPPSQEVWRAAMVGDSLQFSEPAAPAASLAIVGARPCELAALDVLDRVLKDGAHRDPVYAERRERAFVAVVECATPAATCFCSSMGTGPGIEVGFDLALTEIDDADGHRFVVRAGSDVGANVLSGLAHEAARDEDLEARGRVLDKAAARMGRHLQTEGLASLLARNVDHPRWADVAERCLSCANCTLVCPTCFCSDVRDTTDLGGALQRRRVWSSCFDLDHSYLHGGAVRTSASSRYRQWMTHKLSTWWDQFDTSGCVGCGRCIAWCPVGIDITEEAAFIAASDDATTANAVSKTSAS